MPRIPDPNVTVQVPLFSPVYKNVDGTVATDKSFVRYNSYVDEENGYNSRPGEVLAYNHGAAPTGIYSWINNYLVVTSLNLISFYVSTVGETDLTLSSSQASASFLNSVPATFANDSGYLLAAAGSGMFLCDTSLVSTVLTGSPPTVVTHVAYLDGYMLANSTDNKFYWSDLLDPVNWDAANYAQAFGNPDKIVALHVHERQIYLFGESSIEIWENDGDSPFSRIAGGYVEVGCIAPYSIIKLDDSIIFLGDKRYFVELKGGAPTRISSPYDKEIYSLSDISDCIASRIDAEGRTFCVFQFTKSNRTLVYEPISKQWTEWASWNPLRTDWDAIDYFCGTFDFESQKTFIGKPTAKKIACLDSSSRVELTLSGTNSIKVSNVTGWLNYGNNNMKRSEQMRLRLKRGDQAAGQANPVMVIRWRDDGNLEWIAEEEIDLGNEGDNVFEVEIDRLGIFKSRQYEVYVTDAVPVVISQVEEDLTILNR